MFINISVYLTVQIMVNQDIKYQLVTSITKTASSMLNINASLYKHHTLITNPFNSTLIPKAQCRILIDPYINQQRKWYINPSNHPQVNMNSKILESVILTSITQSKTPSVKQQVKSTTPFYLKIENDFHVNMNVHKTTTESKYNYEKQKAYMLKRIYKLSQNTLCTVLMCIEYMYYDLIKAMSANVYISYLSDNINIYQTLSLCIIIFYRNKIGCYHIIVVKLIHGYQHICNIVSHLVIWGMKQCLSAINFKYNSILCLYITIRQSVKFLKEIMFTSNFVLKTNKKHMSMLINKVTWVLKLEINPTSIDRGALSINNHPKISLTFINKTEKNKTIMIYSRAYNSRQFNTVDKHNLVKKRGEILALVHVIRSLTVTGITHVTCTKSINRRNTRKSTILMKTMSRQSRTVTKH